MPPAVNTPDDDESIPSDRSGGASLLPATNEPTDRSTSECATGEH